MAIKFGATREACADWLREAGYHPLAPEHVPPAWCGDGADYWWNPETRCVAFLKPTDLEWLAGTALSNAAPSRDVAKRLTKLA